MNPRVDWYFAKNARWEKELRKLRTIALDCRLTEEVKWGCPCYTLNASNIVLIHVFKQYCALLFFKGALLKDGHRVLVQQTKNVQAARQIRFTNVREVLKMQRVVKAYILEAIEVQKSGLQVELRTTAEFEMPAEFKEKLKKLPALSKAFYALTPGRQRGYLLHFSMAKQSKTREARVAKCVQPILHGKGLDD
ncbi:MAG TPA: YdeI/OmpD-associated family protein [Steroidobacteraceae bacterium]|nr:YdeI/OmpD-associated family protein [Steroidobacteraceae bacterium]